MGNHCSKKEDLGSIGSQHSCELDRNRCRARSWPDFSLAEECSLCTPNITEGGRLNLQHHLFREMFGGPNHSGVTEEQLKKGLTVLDIGCGTGIWLAEMQRDFPNGKYYGVDIVTTAWAETFKDLSSDSISLSQGNVLERLPFEDNTFDYVHQQMLVLGVPAEKWPHVVSEICRVVKPGGVVDLVEISAVLSSHEPQNKREIEMWEILVKLFSARGINLRITENLAGFVKNEGRFGQVVEHQKEAPVGWGGTVGELWRVDCTKVFLGVKPFVTAALGISGETWEANVESYFDDAAVSKTYINVIRVNAVKK
ncbi:S-adenosyl-L-methionine-dependent methyltransferase [Cladochytrium replicatum]|nr:S-adenosyl-L-methionine-dependent methyltransferase [Cladochytrium replicatum]